MRRQQVHPTPSIQLDHWSLSIGGQVRVPQIWSWSDLALFPTQTFESVVMCSASCPPPDQIAWTGIPLASLLGHIEFTGDYDYAKAIGYDGFSASVTLQALRQAWIATSRSGQALAPGDGFPARLIVPAVSGYKSVKWLTRIEIGASPNDGFWEQRGWSSTGTPEPRAWLDHQKLEVAAGQRAEITGSAFAGNTAIRRIMISINYGDWMPADVVEPSRSGLTRWRASWTPHTPGTYTIAVRAFINDESDLAETPVPNQSLFRRADFQVGRIEVSA